MIEKLPQQLHVVLSEEFQITCTATNVQDAPMKLMFSWRVPDGITFSNMTTDEDDGHRASSTLHIGRVTHNHSGVYQCFVRNDGHQRNNNFVTSTTVIVEGNYTTIASYFKL